MAEKKKINIKEKLNGMSKKTKKTLKAVGLGLLGVGTALIGGFVGYKAAEAGFTSSNPSDGEGEVDDRYTEEDVDETTE